MDPGFTAPEELLTVRLSLPEGVVTETADVGPTHERILRSLEAVPGVVSAGVSSSVAMDGNDNHNPIIPQDFPYEEGDVPPVHRVKEIAGDYFQTMGIPMLAGRALSWPDLTEQRFVAVVNESFARTYWSDPAVALGKRIRRFNPARKANYEIVGVVGDVRRRRHGP